MSQRVRVKFEIQRFECDPQEITAQLGLEPTQTWRKGDDTMPRLGREKSDKWKGAKFNYWGMDSGVDVSDDVEKHISALLKKMRPQILRIKSLDTNYDVRIWVSAHFYTDNNPGLFLDSRLIQELAEFKLDLDLEVWCPGLNEKEAQEYINRTPF